MPLEFSRTTDTETSIADTKSADACTRSGAFVLLLSLLLFSLTPEWFQEPTYKFLNQYINSRLNLIFVLDQLDSDLDWSTYKISNPEVQSFSIDKLLTFQIEKRSGIYTVPKSRNDVTDKSSTSKKHSSVLPAPELTDAVIIGTMEHFSHIAEYLTKLDETELLNNKRLPFKTIASIFKWEIRKDQLMNQNRKNSTQEISTENFNTNILLDDSLSQTNESNILKLLTLQNVIELAHYELPKYEEAVLAESVGTKEIKITPGTLKGNLFVVSVFAEVLMLFGIIYFMVFAKEATLSKRFPMDGTLFGAFSRTSFSVFVFGFFLCIPIVVSLTIAVISSKLALYALFLVVLFVVILIIKDLHRKLFFLPLTRLVTG